MRGHGTSQKLLEERQKKLLVSFAWTNRRGLQMLMAAAVFKGRSVPLCWARCEGHTYAGHKSRNAFEESLLLVLDDGPDKHGHPSERHVRPENDG